jgi:beta-glucosidase
MRNYLKQLDISGERVILLQTSWPFKVKSGKRKEVGMAVRCLAGLVLFLISTVRFPIRAQDQYPFNSPQKSLEERINNILSLMTLDEKIACLGATTAVPRLGIPNAGLTEGLHGLVRKAWGQIKEVPTTQFALAVGMAQTWDPDLLKRAGAAEGFEARYITQSEKYRTPALVIWAPNADLVRDPRWGRAEESYGEDPFLNGKLAASFIKGLQGDDPKYWQAAALLKHFMANSNEDNRIGSSSDFDARLMREYYSVPFRMGFLEGGARSFMESYNAWNGIPMTAHPIVTSLVREWGVDGIISTDAGGMKYMVSNHRYYKTLKEAAAGALKIGTNQFLDQYQQSLKEALQENLVSEQDIDAALRGKFRTVLRLGLLDPPRMVSYSTIGNGPEPWNTEANRGVARAVARESIVLLKNSGNFLPLKKEEIHSVAVIGPRADEVQYDYYSGPAPYLVTPLQGIKEKAGAGVEVRYAADNSNDAAVNAAKASDVAIVIVGNHPWCGVDRNAPGIWNDSSTVPCALKSEGREGRDRVSITLESEELVKQVHAANPKTVVVLITSFPYAIVWSQEHVPAILAATHATQELGNALAEVLFGEYNPSGKLTTTWVKSLDQLPPMMDYNIRHGRTYMYFKGRPLYPFGYGLSYTHFQYMAMSVSNPVLKKDGQLTVRVVVRNTGGLAGEEVVQLYVAYPKSKVERPIKELKGFKRLKLQPGGTTTVEIPLKAESLAYWDEGLGKWIVEERPVIIMVGGSSSDIQLRKNINVVNR